MPGSYPAITTAMDGRMPQCSDRETPGWPIGKSNEVRMAELPSSSSDLLRIFQHGVISTAMDVRTSRFIGRPRELGMSETAVPATRKPASALRAMCRFRPIWMVTAGTTSLFFRSSSGTWYWLRSSDGQYRELRFGLNGDIPIRGDFDGDGKQDFTVFRPSNSTWYTLRSTDFGYSETRFGLNGDVPVAGKYDGDGKTDIGVFRPSDGHWYILRSSDGSYSPAQFGLNGDIPVIAR